MDALEPPIKGHVTLSMHAMSLPLATAMAIALLSSAIVAQDDALSQIVVNPDGNARETSNNPLPADSTPPHGAAVHTDSSLQAGSVSPHDVLSDAGRAAAVKSTAGPADRLVNIAPTMRNIRVHGWGEYRVAGRCLCCDNMLDGDCIIIHNTNRTERLRIKQIVDGRTEADTSDKTTYFGDILQRDLPIPVSLLMVEISLSKPREIRRVTVHTMVDKQKRKSFLSTCELGYYDQFDRLQWVGKLENRAGDDHVSFELDKPVLTSMLLIKVKDGRSRITEVSIFSEDVKE